MKKIPARILAVLLCCVMLLTFAACNKTEDKSDASAGDNTAQEGSNPAGDSSQPGNGGGNASEGPATGPGDSPGGQPNSAPVVSARDTLTIATSGDGGTLNPYGIWGGFVGVVRQYMEVLLDYKEGMEKVWVLATNIEEVSTSQWIIHLREGVKFSNGSDFNAYDVEFTFNYLFNDARLRPYIPSFDMDNSKVLDDYTYDLRLNYYEVTQMDALSMVYMLDAETFDEDDFVLNPVGTGPYVITEYVINSHLHMKANDNYWGEKAKIENLHFALFSEDSQIVNALEAGTVDLANIPTQDISYVDTLPNYNVETRYSVFCPNVAFNVSEYSVMNNLDARLAICYAIDRQAIIDFVYFGYADLVRYPISEHCRDFEERLANMHPTYSIGRDVDLARQHAEAAGLVGKDVVIITNGSSTYVTTAEILQANLKEIGVNLEIRNYDAATYGQIANDLTVYDLTCYATASPQQLAIGMLYSYILYTPALAAGGWPGYEHFMEIGVAAIANPSAEERSDILYEMNQIFVDAVLWYGLCDIQAASAVNKDIGGAEFWSNGDCRFVDWYWKS